MSSFFEDSSSISSSQSLLLTSNDTDTENKNDANKYNVKQRKGILFILSVVVIWICSSFIIQFVEGDAVNPFSLTIISISTFALLLPWKMIMNRKIFIIKKRNILVASGLLPLWLGSTYFYNLSLCSTSVTTSTLLSSTSSIFTFLISFCTGYETNTFQKGVGVVLCFLGVYLSTLNIKLTPSDNSNSCSHFDTWLGDFYALISAMFYALYSVYLKAKMKDEQDSGEIFGIVGLLSIILFLPFVIIFNDLHNSLSSTNIRIILINALFNNLIADVLWAKAVVLTSPTIVTVGIGLTIPITAILDTYINHVSLGLASILSCICVASSFVIVLRGSSE